MLSREPVAIFTKEKIKMRAGETDKSVSVKDEKLFALLRTFVKTAGLRGIVDIDLFKINAEYYISEVNPRFGGGYPHAYECGVNVPGMIIKNLKGNENQDIIGQYAADVYMMKYNDVKILR
jgi:carbamoyl-phosphate synthase large subunit